MHFALVSLSLVTRHLVRTVRSRWRRAPNALRSCAPSPCYFVIVVVIGVGGVGLNPSVYVPPTYQIALIAPSTAMWVVLFRE